MDGFSAFLFVVFWNLFMIGIFWLLFEGIPQLFRSEKKDDKSNANYSSNKSKTKSSSRYNDFSESTDSSSPELKEKLDETHKREINRLRNLSKDTPYKNESYNQKVDDQSISSGSNPQFQQKRKPLKKESNLIKNFLVTNGIKTLYHFTDRENLDSIRKHGGLYSWEYCEKNSITIIRPGGNQLSRDLDSRKNLGNYVRLSFKRNIPMLYIALGDGRLHNPFTLEIDPEVILWEDTLFCDSNATSSKSKIGKDFSYLKKVRFDILNKSEWTSDEEKHFWQAEILIKQHIPLKFIRNI